MTDAKLSPEAIEAERLLDGLDKLLKDYNEMLMVIGPEGMSELLPGFPQLLRRVRGKGKAHRQRDTDLLPKYASATAHGAKKKIIAADEKEMRTTMRRLERELRRRAPSDRELFLPKDFVLPPDFTMPDDDAGRNAAVLGVMARLHFVHAINGGSHEQWVSVVQKGTGVGRQIGALYEKARTILERQQNERRQKVT
jgi:hypothetical protein